MVAKLVKEITIAKQMYQKILMIKLIHQIKIQEVMKKQTIQFNKQIILMRKKMMARGR